MKNTLRDGDKKTSVLLVDDEETFVKNLARLLEGRGFEVTTALDGCKALDAVKASGGFDVILLDVKMPGMDGVETLGKIKKCSPGSEVIMLTGHATIDSGTQAIRDGAYDYLMKPCDIEDITEKIIEACEAKSIRRKPVLWPRTRVEEITLYSFRTCYENESLATGLSVLKRETGEMAAEILFVLDSDERLRGVVTRRDLVDEARSARHEVAPTWIDLCSNPQWLPDKTLGKVTKPAAVTADPDESLAAVADRMITHRARRVPVIKENRMTGVIRLEDILKHVVHRADRGSERDWNGGP